MKHSTCKEFIRKKEKKNVRFIGEHFKSDSEKKGEDDDPDHPP